MGHSATPSEGIFSSTGILDSATRNMAATRGYARKFWHLFDKCAVPMVTVDNRKRYLAANTGARLLFRLTLAEMRERRIEDFTPPHMTLLLDDAWSRLMEQGEIAGRYDVAFTDDSRIQIVYCALANVLPAQHLIVFAPAEWPGDELGSNAEPAPPATRTISPREQEVLSLIASGADPEQIAAELSISVNTVRTHIINAYRKLGARNRAHAIALAMQLDLLDLPGRPH
jgi:LuxR family transcriptional regulator of spore coat protein